LRALATESFDEVAIEGDRAGYVALASLIRATGRLTLDHAVDAAAYPRSLLSIVVVEKSSDGVEITSSSDGTELRIARPRAVVDTLAHSLGDYPAGMEPGTHLHEEFYFEHPYLAESAVPLVLERSTY